MNDAELQRLHASVFSRDDKLRGECPGDELLADFLGRTIERRLDTDVSAHLTECFSCRRRVEELDAAGAWFETRREQLLRGVLAGADAEAPARCPSALLVQTLARNRLPRTRAGDALRERLQEHLRECERCRRVHATRLTVRRLLDRALGSVDEAVGRLLAGLQELGSHLVPVAVAGYRAETASVLDALVFDADGRLALDEDGEPVAVRFDIVRAELSADGRFVLDLSTADRGYWKSDAAAFVAAATLEHGSTQLELPDEEILGSGRATIIVQFAPGLSIERIPTKAIRLTIRPARSG